MKSVSEILMDNKPNTADMVEESKKFMAELININQFLHWISTRLFLRVAATLGLLNEGTKEDLINDSVYMKMAISNCNSPIAKDILKLALNIYADELVKHNIHISIDDYK